MELSRQEYPNLLTTLQPGQAVNVLNDRIKIINKINIDIADWLQERRKVEELYITGLRKLARRPQLDGASALGIFQDPWKRIVTATEAIASSHDVLANKLEMDVERPLRNYATKNREMQAMSTIQGNLGAMAKELERAQRESDKLKTKGGKANKVANVNISVEDAQQQWESQAPYVFEQLQSIDENRLNHLRDVLTQFQTHEADQVERNRVTAENTLNALLNVETVDEIKAFAVKVAGQRGSVPREINHHRRHSIGTAAHPPPPAIPDITNDDDGRSERSGPSAGPSRPSLAPEPPAPRHSGLGGLKRLGTVISSRRKSMVPSGSHVMPEKEKRSFRPFGRRGESDQSIPDVPARGGLTTITSNEGDQPQTSQFAQTPEPVPQPSHRDLPRTPDPDAITPAPLPNQTPATNGVLSNSYPVLQPTSATTPTAPSAPEFPSPTQQPQTDSQGFSAPPPATDEITRAQQEAASFGESEESMPYNLKIRDKPIPEEEEQAKKAMDDMANTLRATQISAPSRKVGTVRGRREVRNTVFIPSGSSPGEVVNTSNTDLSKPFSPAPGVLQTPVTAAESIPPAASFLERAPVPSSDTTSIRSAQTHVSTTRPNIVHPEMTSPGLNASVVETVSTWFTDGNVTKASVLGEIALVYNATSGFDSLNPSQPISLRIDNFALLEKVAANPVLATPSTSSSPDSTPGIYNIAIPQVIGKPHPPVAFKYQLHLDAEDLTVQSPVLLTPHWKIEPSQASVIVSYAINPAFQGLDTPIDSITLKNVLLTISLHPSSAAKAVSATMKPEGALRKATSTVYWRLDNLSVTAKSERLLARFLLDGNGEAKAGPVEARWELPGYGSALGLSEMEESGRGSGDGTDPFADEKKEDDVDSAGGWKSIKTETKLISGKYGAD